MPKTSHIAGGVVLLRGSNNILVVNQNSNSWSLPKGHVNEGELALAAAKREIKEESGVSELEYILTLPEYERYKISLDGGDEKGELKKMQFFLFTTGQTALKPEDPENPEARWVPIDKVSTLLTHTKDKEFFESVIPEIRKIC